MGCGTECESVGDMRLLGSIPSDALAAHSSIIGTGATPEGIDQNPAYYEYMYDTAWHKAPQPLAQWFETYSSRRYGNTDNSYAAEAWKILSTTVYNSQAGGFHDDTGVEWNGLSTAPTAQGIDIAALLEAWQLLLQAGATLNPEEYDTLNYDIVNVGREVIAQLITKFEANLTTAVHAGNKKQALATASMLVSAYSDIDSLVGCDPSFLLGAWIADARKWADDADAPASYYEWQARSQVSTWWPVAPSDRKVNATYTKLPVLDNYANKHWNGLIRDFYAKRVQCYIDQIVVDMRDIEPLASTLDATNLTKCVVTAEMDFTQATDGGYATQATTANTLPLSAKLVAKYRQYI